MENGSVSKSEQRRGLVAVLMFGEPFTLAHKVCLGFIWVGLALISFESVRTERTKRQDAQGGTQE